MTDTMNNNDLHNEYDTATDLTNLDSTSGDLHQVAFLNTPIPVAKALAGAHRHINKLGKGIHKRKQVKGGRINVGTRLTAEQMAKVEWLIEVYTEQYGTKATVSSVIAELIDKAMPGCKAAMASVEAA
ncbi:MAG: hypothetical protein ACR652_25685 [Methylocystis sp.]|uniref:hypothetical protein n=1 Tax=Methylocystis sp. TaxID=1911079 RepID=UPI003DA39590